MIRWMAIDNVQDDGHGLGGWGALVVLLMIAASVALFFFMRRSLGRIDFEEKDPDSES